MGFFTKQKEVKYKGAYDSTERTKIVTVLAPGAIWTGTTLALLLFFFIFCFRIIGVGQVGIVTRFGQISREEQSGIVVKAPWPIEHLTKMNIRTQKEEQNAAAATHDLQNVTTSVAVNYNLTPKTAFDVYRSVGTEYKTVVIDPVLQNSIKSITSQYDAADLISKRPEVAQKLTDLLTSKLLDRGITVTTVNITNLEFSKEFDASIEAKQVAQQNAQKAQYDLQRAQLEAQANSAQSAALSEQILTKAAIDKWNGVLPSTYSSNGGNLLFNIPAQK